MKILLWQFGYSGPKAAQSLALCLVSTFTLSLQLVKSSNNMRIFTPHDLGKGGQTSVSNAVILLREMERKLELVTSEPKHPAYLLLF